jgi:hypothetical protein
VGQSVASAGKAAGVAVGAATPLTTESPQLAAVAPSHTEAAVPATYRATGVASGAGSPSPALLIACGLLLAFAGWQVLRRLHRRRQRARLEAMRDRQKAHWEAAVSQIRLEWAPEASKPAGRRPRRVEPASDSGRRSARAGGATGWNYRRARRTPAKAE